MIFALLLIVAGIIFLGLNFGLLQPDVLINLWRFWPVLLIALGIVILGKRHIPKWFATLLVGVMFFAVLAGVIYWDKNIHNAIVSRANEEEVVRIDEPLSANIEKLSLTLNLGAQNIVLDALSSGLLKGTILAGRNNPKITIEEKGNTAEVRVRQHIGWLNRALEGQTDLQITNQIPVDLWLNLGATDLKADFSKIILNSLSMNAGAGANNIKLGTMSPKISVEINAGASNIKIMVPKASGLKVQRATGLVAVEYNDIEMGEESDKYIRESTNFGAANNIEVNLKAGASSVEFIGY